MVDLEKNNMGLLLRFYVNESVEKERLKSYKAICKASRADINECH